MNVYVVGPLPGQRLGNLRVRYGRPLSLGVPADIELGALACAAFGLFTQSGLTFRGELRLMSTNAPSTLLATVQRADVLWTEEGVFGNPETIHEPAAQYGVTNNVLLQVWLNPGSYEM